MFRSRAHAFALVGGITYILIGIVGFFVTGLGIGDFVSNTDDRLLVFDLNPFHNFVHIGAGALLVGASRFEEPGVTDGVTIGVGLILIVAALLGYTGALDHLLSIDGKLAADNFLHLITGVLAVVVGATDNPRVASSAPPV
ncbi:MAG TPA: DUF4383 domain-containing protein [Actinomycetota bacterium]|nr:DUF4383 domain-containing protein [Actinomycetota bacterium]